LWKDARIQAAWPVAIEALAQVETWKQEARAASEPASRLVNRKSPIVNPSAAFARFLKETVNDESVPQGIPAAIPWDDLAAEKNWTSTQLKKTQAVRGKLNVPRERFQQTEDGQYVWAGKN
jgi:hypothetical protein